MKTIIFDIGHSEKIKADNPLETEIADKFCHEMQQLIIDDMKAGILKDLASMAIPYDLSTVGHDNSLMGKIYYANEVAKRCADKNIYFSCHCNWSNDNKKAMGWDIFVKDLKTAANKPLAEESTKLANAISDQLKKDGIKPFAEGVVPDSAAGPGSLAVCSYTTMPAVLIELGFLSTEQEKVNLKDAAYRSKMVRSCYEGIKKYFYA